MNYPYNLQNGAINDISYINIWYRL